MLLHLSLTAYGRKIKRIEANTKWLVMRHITPGPLTIKGQITMADRIQFQVALPAPPETLNDISHGKLTVDIPGEEQIVLDSLTLDQETVGPFEGPQDSEVTLSFVYVDDAGNESEPSEATVTLIDTFPPPAPGALGITVTGETHAPEVPTDPDPGTPSESAS